mmetsp:Transcript_110854/g.192135  ORF Transcript_110854/g.192135 Transcript_110854/m.192135 type:complete len:824 (-) Transcript_110854:76-2547(-)
MQRMVSVEASQEKEVAISSCPNTDMVDLVSSVPGHDDPSEPPMTSYPSGGSVMHPPLVQYPPGMVLVPGVAPNGAPIVWDMGMMAMPMEAPWPLPEVWSMNNKQFAAKAWEASSTRSPQARPGRARKFRARSLVSRSSKQFADDHPIEHEPEPQERPLDLSQFPSLPESKPLAERAPTVERLWPRPAPVVKASMCSVAVQCDLGTQCDSIGAARNEVAVQCEEASKSSSCTGAQTCQYCGRAATAAAAEAAGATDEIRAAAVPSSIRIASEESRQGEHDELVVPSTPEVHAWGPANDWAWDRCSVDEEMSSEDTNSDDGAQLQLKLEQDRLQRSLPPAPSVPPPLPPQKAKCNVQPCPNTPVSCSTRTPSSAANSPAADDMSTGSERGIEVPHVDFIAPERDSLADRLQRQVARLRKRCREAERLEDRAGHGLALNADQQMKAERLGPAQQLRAEILQVEARIARATEGPDVSDSDDSDDECTLGQATSTLAADGSLQKDNVHEASADLSEPCSPNLATSSAAQHSVTHQHSAAPRQVPGRLERRHCKVKDRRAAAAAASLRTSQGNLEQAGTNLKLQTAKSHIPSTASAKKGVSKKHALLKNACGATSKIWRVCIALGVLAAAAVLSRELILSRELGEVWGQQQDIADVQEEAVSLLLPGSSHAWAAERPQDTPSRVQNQRVSVKVRSQDAEVTRGHTAARQMQDKLKHIKEQMRQQRMAKYYQRQHNHQRHIPERQAGQPDPYDFVAWQQWHAQEMYQFRLQYYAQTGRWPGEESAQWQQMMYHQHYLQAQAQAQVQAQAQMQGHHQHHRRSKHERQKLRK